MPVRPASRYRLFDLFIEMEAALKQMPRYQDGIDGGQARANWSRFAKDAGPELHQRVDPEVRQVLITRPPMREIIVNERPEYDPNTPPLPGGHRWETAGARLVIASVRVRNNLFHGGKEDPTRERYPMHDQAVVDAAIEVFGYSKAILKRMA